MSKGKQRFSAKMKYAFDNFMSKGGFSVFMALLVLFVGAILIMSVARAVANLILPQEKFSDFFSVLWIQFTQVADGGSIAEDAESNFLHRIVGIITMFLGLILFSSLVAFITSQFEAKMEELKKGKSDVIENDHTLILGFGDRVLEIIRELIIANESEKSPAIVVLADVPKDEMDEFFRDRIEDWKTTRIVTREGPPSTLQFLRRAGVNTAKSVIILNQVADDAPVSEKALGDARVLKSILAVVSCTGEADLPPVLAELHLKTKQNLALNIVPGKISIIDDQSILAKLMVQTSRISGLAKVYDNLVGFDGCEFYFHRPEEGWGTLAYRDLLFHYANCSVLGLRTAEGVIRINPAPATMLQENDEAVVLAEDDSVIRFEKKAVAYTKPTGKPAQPQPKNIESQLIVGWSGKTSIIVDEYSNYLFEGSKIDVVVPDTPDEIKKEFSDIQAKHPTIKMRMIKADVSLSDVVAKLKPEQYDNIILLAGDGADAELLDSETIATLLEFRNYFRNLGGKVKTQLITEVADSENIEIIEEAGVKDFLISNQFVSKIYAQVSEEPDVLKIYEDLFCSEGSEVYLKSAALFFERFGEKRSFADICAAALERGETCFGIRLKAEEDEAERHYGIYLNPAKSDQFTLSPEDSLITLAEDET